MALSTSALGKRVPLCLPSCSRLGFSDVAPGWTASHTSRWKSEKAAPSRTSSFPLAHSDPTPPPPICACPPSGAGGGLLRLCGYSIGGHHCLEPLLSELHITSRVRAYPRPSLSWGKVLPLPLPFLPNGGTFIPSRWELSRKLGLANAGGGAIALILTESQCPLLAWAFPPTLAPGEPHLMPWKARAPVLPEGLYP